jgi:hypothetical protein
MRIKRHALCVCLVSVALAACGSAGSGSKATTSPATTSSAGSPVSTRKQTTAATAPKVTTKPGGSPASSADLAALSQQLNDAGSALHDSDAAISGTDVDAARGSEGSAP